MPLSAPPFASDLVGTARIAQPNATMPHVIYIAVAALLLLVVAIFAVMLMLQRRRRRAQIMLALAAEDVDRRRKKRKRAGLRTAEIERFCPEMIVVPSGTTISADFSDEEESPSAAGDADTDVPEDEPADPPKKEIKKTSGRGRAAAAGRLNKDTSEFGAGEDVRSADSQTEIRTASPIEIEPGNETCVICLDDMVVDQRVRKLPCSHIYHSSCIRLWLRRKNACPCCCKTVVKRKKRKKKPRRQMDMPVQMPIEINGRPVVYPTEPARPASFSATTSRRTSPTGRLFSTSRSMPCVDPSNSATPYSRHVVNITSPHLNPMDRLCAADRVRAAALPRDIADVLASTGTPSLPRNGSLLDPEDPTSEVLNSEASSHFDEQMANQLLDHVRQVIRGEIGMVDEYSTDGDVSDACLDFHEDDDSLLLENVQLNNPFRGHAAPSGLPRPTAQRDSALSRQHQRRPAELEHNMTVNV